MLIVFVYFFVYYGSFIIKPFEIVSTHFIAGLYYSLCVSHVHCTLVFCSSWTEPECLLIVLPLDDLPVPLAMPLHSSVPTSSG